MKHLYLVIFLLFFAVGFGQSSQNQGDIPGFSMYPNPVTNGKVYISTANNNPKQIFIYDVFGTLILKTTIIGKELGLTDLDAGVYVLRVMEKDKMATRKLIIK